jgi:magnesium transporter
MIIDCAVYTDGVRSSTALAIEDAFEASREKSAFVWIGLYEPTEGEFDSVRREFGLHELAIEDAVKAHQRPKVEVYGDSLFVVLKTIQYDNQTQTIKFGEIQLFVGDHFLITVRHGEPSLSDTRHRLEQRPELLRQGPAAALHAIVDKVVDDYQPVMLTLDGEVRDVEAQVFSTSRSNPAERIYRLKREVLAVHEAVSPLPDEMDRLARGQHETVPDEMLPYFRDVHDHLVRLVVQVESFRDLLTSVLTANLTQVTVRQNDDMRKISAWAAMVAVPTMIAGIYGMNFEHMPELGWAFGYPLVLAVIAAVCIGIYRYFRHIGWL